MKTIVKLCCNPHKTLYIRVDDDDDDNKDSVREEEEEKEEYKSKQENETTSFYVKLFVDAHILKITKNT